MIIYKITNLINNKCYVGQTKRSLDERWYGHCSKDGCTALHNAILKYGKESFKIEIIDRANTESELNEKERYWIEKLNTIAPLGYNLRSGGDRFELSEVSKQRLSNTISQTWKEHKYIATWKRKICQYTLDGNLIRVWDSMSEAANHLNISDKHIPDVCLGKRRSCGGFMWRYYEDTLGEPIVFPKRKRNPKRWFDSHRKEIDQFDKDGNFIKRWNSALEASQALGISTGQLCDTCKGKHKSAKGYIWKYA